MPLFPVGDARDYALARRLWEERAEKAFREAWEKAPRPSYVARLPADVCPVNADPDVVEDNDREWLEPLARSPRFSQGGIVHSGRRVSLGPTEWVARPPEPLVCDCGHPATLHRTEPGVGCTHRPYCLCVHPTGQRVPLRPGAPPFAPDPALIVRTLR